MKPWSSIILSVWLASCSGAGSTDAQVAETRGAIKPQQFALIACKDTATNPDVPCKLLAAGGKYFLFGAPEGAFASLRPEEARLLDGVLLFSMLPQHIDGLDTLRYETWRLGRAVPLLVVGPEGTKPMTRAIDTVFEISDAELFAIESPAGGFDASLLRGRDVNFDSENGDEVVNTGDLIVRGYYAPSGQIVYQIKYNERTAAIGMCGGEEDSDILAELAEEDFMSPCHLSEQISYIIQ